MHWGEWHLSGAALDVEEDRAIRSHASAVVSCTVVDISLFGAVMVSPPNRAISSSIEGAVAGRTIITI